MLRLAMPLVVGFLALAPAAAGTGDTVVATVSGVGPLSAYGGVTAWIHAVGDRARVSYLRNGVIRDLPGSFPEADLDLGPSRDGRSVDLVISRCGRDGCVVTSTDTRTGRTARVHGLDRLRCAGLRSPSIWRRTIAVAGERCGRHAVDGLYVRDGAGRTRRLITLKSASFSETDVDGAHAVVTDEGDSSVRIVALRSGRSRIVWQGEESASFSDSPISPLLDGGMVVWLERSSGVGLQFMQWLGAAPATVHPSKTCARRQLPSDYRSIAVARGRLVYATADAVAREAAPLRCSTST